MIEREELSRILSLGITPADGAMGTRLIRNNKRENLHSLIREIHNHHIAQGARIIRTNTFAAPLEEYHTFCGIALEAATESEANVLVAGSLGPQSVTAQKIDALIREGVDFIWLETIYDRKSLEKSLNAVEKFMNKEGRPLTFFISGALNKYGNAFIDGMSIEKFVDNALPFSPAAIGFNCGWGPYGMENALQRLSTLTDLPVIFCPSAGIPDKSGNYPVTPEDFTRIMRRYIQAGLVQIPGGCCGT